MQLTEEETEYKVVCVRHVLEGHIVFQFDCTNTVKEQVLEEVSVTMDLADAVSSQQRQLRQQGAWLLSLASPVCVSRDKQQVAEGATLACPALSTEDCRPLSLNICRHHHCNLSAAAGGV